MAVKDVAVPIVFPDYLITVDTRPVTIDVPDWIPGVPNVVRFPKTKNKLPFLGHAGILFFSGRTGVSKYFEYGRYDRAALGLVRKPAIPDVKISGDKATKKSLATSLAEISLRSGQAGSIAAAYIELPIGAFDKMLAYAAKRMSENKNGRRTPYDLTSNSCMHFMRSVALAGGATMPDVFDPRPLGYIEKVRETYPDLDFSRPDSLTVESVELP